MRVVPIGSKALVEDYLLYGWSSGRDMSAAELQVASWGPEQFDIAARGMMSNQEFLSWRALGRPSHVDVRERKRLCMGALKTTLERAKSEARQGV